MIVVLVRRHNIAGQARAQQELLATCAAFCLPLSIVFVGKAAQQLYDIEADDSLLAMLPSTGIDSVLVDQAGAELVADRVTALPCQPLGDDELRALLQRAQHAVVI